MLLNQELYSLQIDPSWLTYYFDADPKIAYYLSLPLLLLGLFIACFVTWYLTKKIIVNAIHRLFLKTKTTWDDILIEKKIFDKLAYIIPAVLVIFLVPILLAKYAAVSGYVVTLAKILILFVIIRTINAMLSVLNEILSQSHIFKDKPISSYIQVLNILVYFVGGILVLSLLLGKSPFYFLGAMGAMTAVLLLIFKDTILGFVASIQMSVYDMVRVGDWIAMPKYDADGDVMSINLSTVKVQNWDKTITTIPTYAFINDSFKNWRGMSNSGGRRIKRAIYLKVSSFEFCDQKMLDRFKQYTLIRDYIIKKENEIDTINNALMQNQTNIVNTKSLTNIGVFRVYAENYILANPHINTEMTTMVRQLDPTSKGLPLEIYCFSYEKEWEKYEQIKSDIFDHLLTIISQFELEVFEEPTGKDFVHLLDTAKP
ncbi:mechanosensitive ion channel family protein [Flavobacterium crassostreae]|uniref:Mechanosensitive ion channel protein MscS n=1 Tax=Flavobacterium crassostreae TaxID=1763534 RepID=A0A1B9E0Q3_9FLAO|nr:mechanosensitive ion channel domain-containing protein [Flavobacterium crassostreae]OCB75524.1 mechanosensitive ion channel protein MscS [Flavobacterium crassostreae]